MRKAYKKIKVYPSQKTGKVWAYSKNESGNRTWGKIQKDDRGYYLDSENDGFQIEDKIYLSDGRNIQKTEVGYIFLTPYNRNQSNSYKSNLNQQGSNQQSLSQQGFNQQESGQQIFNQQVFSKQNSSPQEVNKQEIISILKDIDKMITLLIKIIERW